jgi:FtsH-binding integral membrane protein
MTLSSQEMPMRDSRMSPKLVGLGIWATVLVLGLLLGLLTNHVSNASLRSVLGISAVVLAGGALGVMGFYIGLQLAAFGRRTRDQLVSKFKL